MKIEIEDVTNGYVITYNDELDDGTKVVRKIVVEDLNGLEFDDNEISQQSFLNLAYEVKELFGVFYSKHNKINLDMRLINKDDKEVDRDTLKVLKNE